ncbi:MAG: hypothetical protein ACXVLQ_12435 [Bacteriovorax sp.]
MKSFLWGLLAALFIINANASDSSWLLCKNKKHADPHDELVPVLSIFEHRNGADGRKTEVYLIYGAHLLTGSLINTDAGKLYLKSPSVKDDTFDGTIKIDYSKNLVSLKGDYISSFDSTHTHYEFKLPCESMN